jgi:hypothetical protein
MPIFGGFVGGKWDFEAILRYLETKKWAVLENKERVGQKMTYFFFWTPSLKFFKNNSKNRLIDKKDKETVFFFTLKRIKK